MGDMANAELGISKVDAIGAKTRDATGNLSNQHKWGLGYLNERITGMLAALTVSALAIVWVLEMPASMRYGVTAVVALLAVAIVVAFFRGKSKLAALRQQQIDEHAS